MNILHTSDWHLGRSLYGRKRYHEFSEFLNWLCVTIKTEKIDVLLVAGDIFDTSTPSNRAQKLYYQFLCKVSDSCCQHIVVVAGNHDSPSFLNAPQELLRSLNVYVVGQVSENVADEVLVLSDIQDHPQAIVCAVPYLRDKDIRTAKAGETLAEKHKKLIQGVMNHYADVCAIAEQKVVSFVKKGFQNIPIIAMGHLFTAGGKMVDGDGVRELYVGSLAHIAEDAFPASIAYLALGHLHVPQSVGRAKHIRYCGSPLPMGFGEAAQVKKVIVVRFENQKVYINDLTVPCFQPLTRIVGSLEVIQSTLEQLKHNGSQAWLEIEYTGNEIACNLTEILSAIIADSSMEILRIKNKPIIDRVLNSVQENETLDDLDVNDVFVRCLDSFEVPTADRAELKESYSEIIKSLHEEDINVE